jgi:hypothetical protein
MNKIIFTLCSNNYLAHAKTLGDSILKLTQDCHFMIGLVDKHDLAVDYTPFNAFEIIPYDSIGFPFFSEMLAVYNVIEFNTSVKPYYFDFLFRKYGKDARILYIDPDIEAYRSMDDLFTMLNGNGILLTPNLVKEPNGLVPGELASLRHGMYNLGFIGIAFTEESQRFLKWWQERLRHHCLIEKSRGIFVDQKWVDLAPLFFKDIKFIDHPGYNMAWWNLSERKLVEKDGVYYVNSTDLLLYFFHFSGYTPGSEFYTGRVNTSNQYSFDNAPELRPLFMQYTEKLKANGFDTLSIHKPLLQFGTAKKDPAKSWKSKIKKVLKEIIN